MCARRVDGSDKNVQVGGCLLRWRIECLVSCLLRAVTASFVAFLAVPRGVYGCLRFGPVLCSYAAMQLHKVFVVTGKAKQT